MKLQLILISLSLFLTFYCQNTKGGIKLQITEEMANEALGPCLEKINNKLKMMNFDKLRFLSNKYKRVWLSIVDISKNMVSIKFLSDKINIKVTGLTGELVTRISRIFFHSTKSFKLNKFNLEIDVKIFSRTYKDGRLVLDGKIINISTTNMNLYQDLKSLIEGNISYENEISQKINGIIFNKCTEILNSFLSLFPKEEIILNSKKGLYADYSLVSPIIMNKGFFEINSYRRIYNKNIPKTQDKNKYISVLPDNINAGKEFKLYISKSNIISSFESFLANDTQFTIETHIDQNKFDSNLLKRLFKFNFQDYDGKSKLNINFRLYRHLKIEFDNNNIYALFSTLILIYYDYQSERSAPAYSSYFNCKAKVNILNGVKIDPTLYDLTYVPEVNNGINGPPSQEELDTLQAIKGSLFPVIKELYKQNINFVSPLTDNIKFSRAYVEYNKENEFLGINFSF